MSTTQSVVAPAIGLAVAGAGCYAVAAWLQQSAVHTVTQGGELRLTALARILRARRWLTGFGLTLLGALLHAAALSLAPLVIVQPIGVLAIALTTLLAARSGGVRLTRGTMLAVGACVLGVGVFVALAAARPATPPLPDDVEVRAGLLVGLLVAWSAGIGAVFEGRVRCVAFASAAGLSYGLVSVLVRATALRVEAGGLTEIHLLSVAEIAAALLVGGWFVQHAYAAGPPQVVVACQTVLDPMLAVGVGIGLLGEANHLAWPALAGLVAATVLAVAGVLALARRPSPPVTVLRTSFVELPAMNVGSLRVVIGADTFPPDINGAAQFAHRLAAGLAQRGHDVHVLCPATSATGSVEVIGGVTVHRVASRRTPFHPTFRICPPWQAFGAAATLLDELRPDLVHVQAHFLLGRALVRGAATRDIPVVATNHFMPENLYGHARIPAWLRNAFARIGWWDLRRVFRAVRIITAPTPRAASLLAEHGVPGVIAVSCGIDLDKYAAQPRPAVDRCRVLFVGRLDEEKRVDELLRALALLESEVDCEIVGDGSCRATWQRLAVELGIADRVVFHGFVDESNLVAAYARADVFVMPGVAELQSLATMEAMAAGTPVVAADAMALPHLVHPGRNGWLFPPGDVPALADRLRRLVTDAQARARMGAASREIIAGHALDATLDRFEGLYHEAIGQPVESAVSSAVA